MSKFMATASVSESALGDEEEWARAARCRSVALHVIVPFRVRQVACYWIHLIFPTRAVAKASCAFGCERRRMPARE
ncbi:hypothetical protein CF166_21120 [Amycolatopsis sp. KNN50.9b]|nr:hypothetical protein CF166_21120 [Amycolatopsis sp. KNN50.9b]